MWARACARAFAGARACPRARARARALVRDFYLDFLIAGPGVSFNKVKFTENLEVADGFYSTLGQELSEYSILESLDINDINIDENKGFNITLPAFRYGIKIGYCF